MVARKNKSQPNTERLLRAEWEGRDEKLLQHTHDWKCSTTRKAEGGREGSMETGDREWKQVKVPLNGEGETHVDRLPPSEVMPDRKPTKPKP